MLVSSQQAREGCWCQASKQENARSREDRRGIGNETEEMRARAGLSRHDGPPPHPPLPCCQPPLRLRGSFCAGFFATDWPSRPGASFHLSPYPRPPNPPLQGMTTRRKCQITAQPTNNTHRRTSRRWLGASARRPAQTRSSVAGQVLFWCCHTRQKRRTHLMPPRMPPRPPRAPGPHLGLAGVFCSTRWKPSSSTCSMTKGDGSPSLPNPAFRCQCLLRSRSRAKFHSHARPTRSALEKGANGCSNGARQAVSVRAGTCVPQGTQDAPSRHGETKARRKPHQVFQVLRHALTRRAPSLFVVDHRRQGEGRHPSTL